MYSNRRRSHIHFIIQYYAKTNEYTGTRIVIFIKGGEKLIYDIDKFAVHRYLNSKAKNYEISMWKKGSTEIIGVIKKEMVNYSLDKKYKMLHIIYESEIKEIQEYIMECFNEQGVGIPQQLCEKLHFLNLQK